MSFARVLERNERGLPVLWQCSDGGQPFKLGWGSRCNRCIKEEERFERLLVALKGEKCESTSTAKS